MRFKDRYIGVTDRPCIIVGERPGRQRTGAANGEAFHGNRTGDFIEQLVKGKQNIILTNAQQEYYPGRLRLNSSEHACGFDQLQRLIERWVPNRVICLGKYAQTVVGLIQLPEDCSVTHLPHPSWTLRFNKPQNAYHETLQHN